MRIEELHLKNFRCFKELDIQFPKSNLVVFIGLNGAGKSAILDVTALLFDNYLNSFQGIEILKYSNDDILINESEVISKAIGSYQDKETEWQTFRYRNNEEYAVEMKNNKYLPKSDVIPIDKPIFIYYKTDRSDVVSITQGFLRNDKKVGLDWFYGWFIEQENIENELIRENRNFDYTNPKLNIVRTAINRFFANISGINYSNLKVKRIIKNVGSFKEDLGSLIQYLVVDVNGVEQKLSQLSSGQRLLLLMVTDISSQLVDAAWDSTNVDNVINRNGIVLIDEIELHLHPQWQREVLPALQKTFPNIQFIVTTHSPQVLSNLKKEEVFILKDNKIVEVTPHIEGRDSNSILYELFGVEERPERFKTQLKQLYNAIDDENLSEAKKILAELTTAFGEQDTEIVRANLHLSFAEE